MQNKADGIRRYDVGVDASSYYPVSVKRIIEFFENNEGKYKVGTNEFFREFKCK